MEILILPVVILCLLSPVALAFISEGVMCYVMACVIQSFWQCDGYNLNTCIYIFYFLKENIYLTVWDSAKKPTKGAEPVPGNIIKGHSRLVRMKTQGGCYPLYTLRFPKETTLGKVERMMYTVNLVLLVMGGIISAASLLLYFKP